eukprot:COSAG02_NODE_4021_length_5891_cov_414.995684_1_plen_1502_part_00
MHWHHLRCAAPAGPDLLCPTGRIQLERVFQLQSEITEVNHPQSPSSPTGRPKEPTYSKRRSSISHSAAVRGPLDPQAMVRLAMETVQGDTRAIYGKSGRSTGRVNMGGERLVEIKAMNRRCFFRPDGQGGSVHFRQTWDLIQIFMLFYVALVVPFRIGFHFESTPTEWIFWWEVVVDLYFWCDIVINCRTAYYDEHNELIIDNAKICKKYLKGWFLLDFLSCLPVTYIGLLVNQNDNQAAGADLKMLKVFRMVRLAKLLRLARVKRLVARLEEQYRFIARGSRVVAIVATIMFTAHLVACTWHMAGSSRVEEIGTDRSTGEVVTLKPWVMGQYGGIGDGSTEDPDFENGLQVSTMTRYVDALYYSVTTLTTVGYGDRVPNTDLEKVISILCELAGSVIFGVIAGSLSTIAMAESMTRIEIKQKISQLNELMNVKNVPKSMRIKFSNQMTNWFAKKSVFDEEMLLSYLPPRQRKDLLTIIYKPFMMQCPLMQGLEWPVVSRMCLMMRPYLAVVNDVIFTEGDVGEEMYLVVRGSMKLFSRQYPAYNGRMWEDGAFFGELPLLHCGGGETKNLHLYTAQALVETDCSYISQDDFEELNVQRPTLRATMRTHALQRAMRFGTDSAASTLMDNLSNSPSSSPSLSVDPDSPSSSFTPDTGDWFADAKKSAPHLLGEEIRDLRAVFLKYASSTGGSEKQLSIQSIQQILDESLKRMFTQLDIDGSGSLERVEIQRLLDRLGMSTSAEGMDLTMAELDDDGSGEVEFSEFKLWWDKSQFADDENRDRELQDLFDAVDTDRSGFIDWREFIHLISTQVLRDIEIGHASRMQAVNAKEDSAELERSARSAGEMVRVALNTVRSDTRSIYGTSLGSRKVKLHHIGLDQQARDIRCFFRPDGKGNAVRFRQAWDVAQVFILFYVAMSVPFRVAFSHDAVPFTATFWFEVCIDVYFWIDIVLNFRTFFYDLDGHLVLDQKQVCMRYLRGWFLIDVVSCAPVMYIEMLIYGTEQRQSTDLIALKSLRLLRMAKLLRLARIKHLLTRLEMQYKQVAQFGRVVKICFSILISAHFVACLWYFVGDGEDQRLGVNAEGEDIILRPWVKKLYGNIEEGVCIESGVEISSTECDRLRKYSVSLVTKYLDALYYSVTTLTTVGYGDRVPNTNSEKLVSILCELAGSVTFGIIAGSLSAIALSESITAREIKDRSAKLDEFMRTKKVPQAMRQEIGTQLSNYFEKKSALDEKQAISCLPPKHQRDLVMAIYQPFLVDCPLLQGLEPALTSQLCLAMRPYFALGGDEIVVEGELGEEMYLITRGTIRLTSTRYPAYNSRQWEDGAFFGELPVLDCGAEEIDTSLLPHHAPKQKPRRVMHVYTATALIDSHCTYVTRLDLDELNLKKPVLKQTMRKFAMQRAERFGVDMGPALDEDEKESEEPLTSHLSGPSGIYGVMQLVETARRDISEARQEHDLGDASADTKRLLDTLSTVDAHLHHIHDTAERIALQNARSKSRAPGS